MIFSENDLQIIKENIDLLPRDLIPLLEGTYTSVQISKCKWWIKNRDTELERMKTYRKENPDKFKNIQKNYRENNKEYLAERNRQWREENLIYNRTRVREYRNSIKKKYNVPDKYGSVESSIVRGIAEEILKCSCKEEVRFDWLVNPETSRVLPVDFYFKKYRLIIEYNGRQHYFETTNWKGKCSTNKERLEKQQERDRHKYSLIQKEGFNLIVVPYNYSKKWLIEQLNNVVQKEGELSEPQHVKRPNFRPVKLLRCEKNKR